MKVIKWILLGLLPMGCIPAKDASLSQRELAGGEACNSVEYEKTSCTFGAYGFEVGESVINQSSIEIETTYFNKKFNQAALNQVLRASPRSTVDVMRSQNLEVFQNGERCGCAIFRSLPLTEERLMRYWEKTASTMLAQQNSNWLLGLYLPQDLVQALGSTVQSALVIVRGDTDRWTLVHEFMHHLFNQERSREGISSPAVERDYKAAISDIDRLLVWAKEDEISISESVKRKSVERFVSNVNNVKNYLLVFPLEEMTIEGILSMHHRRGELKNVPSISRKVAAQYICNKLIEVKKISAHISLVGESMAKKVGAGALLTEIKRSDEKIQKLISDAHLVNQNYGLGDACQSFSRSISLSHSCGFDRH